MWSDGWFCPILCWWQGKAATGSCHVGKDRAVFSARLSQELCCPALCMGKEMVVRGSCVGKDRAVFCMTAELRVILPCPLHGEGCGGQVDSL